jgi:hypothetical protein
MFMEEDCMLQICGVGKMRKSGSRERRGNGSFAS